MAMSHLLEPLQGAPNALMVCDNLVKIYKVDDIEVVALQGLDLEVMRGEMVALVGASGSGKSTLLNVIGGLDAPSAGRCYVAGNDLTRMREEQRTLYRCFQVGHVWQQSGRNLLPELTLQENVRLPQALAGISAGKRSRRADELLEQVGLGHLGKRNLSNSPAENSNAEASPSRWPTIPCCSWRTSRPESLTPSLPKRSLPCCAI